MVFINEAIKEITLKLFYYGPGLSGKTTNLEKIYENAKLGGKGKIITMTTKSDRTIFFDFLPMEFNNGSKHSYFEVSALKGDSVLKTLQKTVHLMIENLNKRVDIGLQEKKEEEKVEEKAEDFLTLLKMLYNSNISSLLEDLKKQEEFLSSYIEKAKDKKL